MARTPDASKHQVVALRCRRIDMVSIALDPPRAPHVQAGILRGMTERTWPEHNSSGVKIFDWQQYAGQEQKDA